MWNKIRAVCLYQINNKETPFVGTSTLVNKEIPDIRELLLDVYSVDIGKEDEVDWLDKDIIPSIRYFYIDPVFVHRFQMAEIDVLGSDSNDYTKNVTILGICKVFEVSENYHIYEDTFDKEIKKYIANRGRCLLSKANQEE